MAIAKTIIRRVISSYDAYTAEWQKIPTWAKNFTIILGSSLLLGLFAHIAIPLPFTPVPIATQGSMVLLLGVLLGSKRAPAAVLAFLAQGAMGLPVFAKGMAGIGCLYGPTGGYLVGYLVAAYAVGKIVELVKQRTLTQAFVAMIAGNIIIFAFGALWLSTFVGASKAFWLGVAPFLFGDLVKLLACVKILQWIRWAGR